MHLSPAVVSPTPLYNESILAEQECHHIPQTDQTVLCQTENLQRNIQNYRCNCNWLHDDQATKFCHPVQEETQLNRWYGIVEFNVPLDTV